MQVMAMMASVNNMQVPLAQKSDCAVSEGARVPRALLPAAKPPCQMLYM
jgi:hypothetical protein